MEKRSRVQGVLDHSSHRTSVVLGIKNKMKTKQQRSHLGYLLRVADPGKTPRMETHMANGTWHTGHGTVTETSHLRHAEYLY